RVEVASQELGAHVAEGTVGWVHDHVSYRVGRDLRRAVLPLRVTAVWVRREGRWMRVQEHVSYPQAREAIVDAARAGKRGKPAAIGAPMAGPEQESAAAAVRAQLVGAVPFTADALVIPPWGMEDRRGQAVSVAALFGPGFRVTDDGLSVELSPGKM